MSDRPSHSRRVSIDLQSNRSSYVRGVSIDLQSNRSSYIRGVSILSSVRSEVSFPESHSMPFLGAVEDSNTAGFSRFLLGADFEDVDLRKKKTVSTPMVVCRVCNHHIPLDGYDLEEHYIVKCTVCKEATPIRAAPPGERYVRCVCNCLLICRNTAEQVACPRLNCQRIITVAKETDGEGQSSLKGSRRAPKVGTVSFPTSATNAPLGTCRLTCGYCRQPFLFNILQKSLCKCPYCHRLSALADEHRHIELRKSLAFAITFLICSVLIILTNVLANRRFAGDIALYITLFVVTALVAIRPIVVLRLKSSSIDGRI